MDINSLPQKNIQPTTNKAETSPVSNPTPLPMPENRETEPQVYPESSVLKTYAGINENHSTISPDDIVNFLKEKGVLNENFYPVIINSLTEQNEKITPKAFNALKTLLEKTYINTALRILNSVKENENINYKALGLAIELLPDSKNVYGSNVDISRILKHLKNNDGQYDYNAMDFLTKHGKTLYFYLQRYEQPFFEGLKNNNNEFSTEALKYIDNLIKEGGKVNTVLNDLLSSKDDDGNFSISKCNFNKIINNIFPKYTLNTINSVVSTFSEEQTQERDNFIEFAKSLLQERNFTHIINFIKEIKDTEKGDSNLDYNTQSAEFVKKLMETTFDSQEAALKIYKNLNMQPDEYTPKILEDLKNLYRAYRNDFELFLNASKNKTGAQKGKLNTETLNKYLETCSKIDFWQENIPENTALFLSCLSLEEDNKALDILGRLYSLEFKEDTYTCRKVDRNLINLAQKILCNYDTENNCPRQKCNAKALDKIEELLNDDSKCISEENFTNSFKEIINDTVKEQYLNVDEEIIEVRLNNNVNTVLEIESGGKFKPTMTFYDFTKGKIIGQTKETQDGKEIRKIQKDFINNTETTTLYHHIAIGSPVAQIFKKFDDKGSLIYTETLEQSSVKSAYNVTRKYADGTEEKICNAYKTPEGNDVIEKHMSSLDGTKTDYRYEDDVTGNRIIDYKITDKNGKTLMNQSITFEVIDENHFVSSRNNKKFDIKFNGNNLEVTNMQTDETVTIELDRFTNWTHEKLLPVLKSFPGDELFAMKKLDLSKFCVDESIENACFKEYDKSIRTRTKYIDLSVLLHELGHAKDYLEFSEIEEKISNDQNLRKIYEEERNNYRTNFGDSQQSYIGYFCADSHYLGKDNSIVEGIAETNTLLSAYPKNYTQNIRSLYWQQYFPRTIAYLSGLLN